MRLLMNTVVRVFKQYRIEAKIWIPEGDKNCLRIWVKGGNDYDIKRDGSLYKLFKHKQVPCGTNHLGNPTTTIRESKRPVSISRIMYYSIARIISYEVQKQIFKIYHEERKKYVEYGLRVRKSNSMKAYYITGFKTKKEAKLFALDFIKKNPKYTSVMTERIK